LITVVACPAAAPALMPPLCSRDTWPKDLEIHRDFRRDFLESTRQAKQAGKTAAAAAKEWKVSSRFAGYEAPPDRVLGAMEWIYRQLP
jgi:hypothetical protein